MPILVGAAALRLALACAPVDWIDTRFVPDDTYYVLALARSIAEGRGPTVDGETLTNGFQPLIVFGLAPVIGVLGTSDLVLRVLWWALAAADVANVALLGLLAGRIGGERAAVAAALVWATSPLALRAALGGMEASLALCLSLALVEAWSRAIERPGTARWAGAGALCGLALLARIDAGALVGALGAWELVRGDRRGAVVAAAVAAAVVAPWWLWSTVHLGSPFPESGRAVRELAYLYQGQDAHRNAMVWAAGLVLPGPSIDLGNARWLFAVPVVGEALTVVAGVAVLALGRAVLAVAPAREARPVVTFLAIGALFPVMYVALVPGLWFFSRYLLPTLAAMAVALGIVLGRPTSLARALLVLSVSSGLATFYVRFGPGFRMEDVIAVEGTSGYLGAMRAAVDQLPDGPVVVGSLQSGALAWVAPPGTTVVNLDGVVDRASFEALREGRLDRVLRARQVTFFVDWELQHRKLLERSRGVELDEVWRYDTPMCSRHELVLSGVVLTDGAE